MKILVIRNYEYGMISENSNIFAVMNLNGSKFQNK